MNFTINSHLNAFIVLVTMEKIPTTPENILNANAHRADDSAM